MLTEVHKTLYRVEFKVWSYRPESNHVLCAYRIYAVDPM